MANCMIHARGLGPQFWSKAINCANYVQNRTPHKAIQGVTLEEVWSGQKPSVGHLRVFGCNAWAYIPKEKRREMDMQSKPCIFVGYPEDVKGYRLLDSDTHELLISRSVRFDERPPQHLVSSYDDPSFELTAPDHETTHENDLEEQ